MSTTSSSAPRRSSRKKNKKTFVREIGGVPRAATAPRKFSSHSRSRMHKGFACDAAQTARRKSRAIFAHRRAPNEKISDCARKISLTVCDNFITHTSSNRVMTFINHSLKIYATRICGLKGGIINGD
jgi:hypothetical protein